MAVMKDMRITFFYTDEKVYDTIKESGGERETLVNWANLFYKKYDLQLDVLPITFNEKLYKQKFCFAKSNGLKADYTQEALYQYEDENIMPLLDASIAGTKALIAIETDAAEKDRLNKELADLLQQKIDFYNEYTDYLTHSKKFEMQFRREIFLKMKDYKPAITKERLPVVFCKFENRAARLKEILTIGQQFELALDDSLGSLIFWAVLYVLNDEKLPIYTGPLIIIDIDAIKRTSQWTLAHEIVHAAGNTTQDNKGSKDNIMNYADARRLTRTPSSLKLEATDKAKLEAAFFVV